VVGLPISSIKYAFILSQPIVPAWDGAQRVQTNVAFGKINWNLLERIPLALDVVDHSW
jgi:hypothetical protein